MLSTQILISSFGKVSKKGKNVKITQRSAKMIHNAMFTCKSVDFDQDQRQYHATIWNSCSVFYSLKGWGNNVPKSLFLPNTFPLPPFLLPDYQIQMKMLKLKLSLFSTIESGNYRGKINSIDFNRQDSHNFNQVYSFPNLNFKTSIFKFQVSFATIKSCVRILSKCHL